MDYCFENTTEIQKARKILRLDPRKYILRLQVVCSLLLLKNRPTPGMMDIQRRARPSLHSRR